MLKEWQIAQWFWCLLWSKSIKTRYRRFSLSSAHTDRCFMGHLFICSWHQGSTGYHIWHLALYSLPHFRASKMANRLPKAVSCGSLKHGEWGSAPLECYKSSPITLQQWPATCKPSIICHRRQIVRALVTFIRQPKLTVHTHREQWRKARRVDVVSYIQDTCSY